MGLGHPVPIATERAARAAVDAKETERKKG